MSEPAPTRPRISPTALAIFQQCLYPARTSGDFDRLVSPEPFSKIAGAAPDRASALQSREAFLVGVLFAAILSACHRDDLRDRRIAIVHNDRAARANVIKIAREDVAQFRDFGFFHGFSIIAKLALSY